MDYRPDPASYGLRDSARYLGVPAETLRTWRKNGVIDAVRIEGRVLFRRTDLDALIQRDDDDG